MEKGIIVKANGEVIEVSPKNGKDFKLEELKAIVNGYIEIVGIEYNGEFVHLVCNEEGKLDGLPFNQKATEIAIKGGLFDEIVGDVLICGLDQIK